MSAAYMVANRERFGHETIDGETVLIDADTGHLLMITGIGSFLWEQLAEGTSTEELIAGVEGQFGAPAGEACREFVQSLAKEELIVPAEEVQGRDSPVTWPSEFVQPAIERYDDISNIIAMDPIHDVDPDAGWPRRSPEVKE